MVGDFDLIVSSFQSQYGIRLSRDLKGMKWDEFKALLIGLDHKTALGRIVSIRAEDDREVLKNFTREQRKIRSDWLKRSAATKPQAEVEDALEQLKRAFIAMSGGVDNCKGEV